MRTATPAALVLVFICGAARGQAGTPTGGEDDTPLVESDAGSGRPLVFRLTARGLHYFGADLDDDDTNSGDVSVSRFGPTASLDVPVGEASTLTFTGDLTYSFYNFDGTGIFDDSTEILQDAYEGGLSASYSSRFDDHWTYFIGGGARLSFEAGADTSDSWTWRFFGGVGYRFSDRLVLGGGVGVSSQLEDDVLVVPVLTAFYRVTDHWMVLAGSGPAAAGRTLGATVTWQAAQDIGVSLTGAWDHHQFRLDDDGPIPDGVATDQRVDIVLGLNWGITSGVSLRLETGLTVWQEYQFDDSDGDEVFTTNTDPTGFVGGGVTFEF